MKLVLIALIVGLAQAAPPVTDNPQDFAFTTEPPQHTCQSPVGTCSQNNCIAPDCHCSGFDSNVADTTQRPQIIYLSYDDAFTAYAESNFYKYLFNGTFKNPDGCAIRATHFLTAQYTDYSLVNQYWKMGHEMASHSITHRSKIEYWQGMNMDSWKKEIVGMRQMTSQLANIPIDHITGMRAPFLQGGGNEMFQMLADNHFLYDCTWTSTAFGYTHLDRGLYPYTLDFASIQDCQIEPCPTCSLPGMWVQPMLNLEDNWFVTDPNTGMPCSMLDGCIIDREDANKTDVYEMLIKNFNRAYGGNRAPFGLYMHAGWFFGENVWHYDGYIDFLREITTKYNDVWIVPISEGIEYMRNYLDYTNDDLLNSNNTNPFSCQKFSEPPFSTNSCGGSKSCLYQNVNYPPDIVNQERYMTMCSNKPGNTPQQCPPQYPWLDNPCGGNTPCPEWTY